MDNPDSHATDFLQQQVERNRIPGAQYVVVSADRVLFNTAVGLADVKRGVPMTPAHRMHGYSMTKTFVAVAVLQLVEQDKIGLDDPLDKYVPDHPYGSAVLVRQLLSHTSGIPNPIPLKWIHTREEHAAFDEWATLQSVAKQHPRLKNPPGTKYRYSNIGYWYLGRLVEVVSGQPFEDYVADHITGPLGLGRDTLGYRLPAPASSAKGYLARYSFMNWLKGFLVRPDIVGGREGRWVHMKMVYMNGTSYSGLVGSATSFARLLQDQLGSESRLLSSRGRALLTAQQALANGDNIDMTLGWHLGTLDGRPYYYKDGGGVAYRSQMRLYPQQGIGSVLIVNRTQYDVENALASLDTPFLERTP